MSRTFSHLFTHIVFSTKGRARLIVPDLKPELHAYLGGLTRELKGKALAINGMEEHVHLLASLPPAISVSDALRFIKAEWFYLDAENAYEPMGSTWPFAGLPESMTT